jgi:hypothetical protein
MERCRLAGDECCFWTRLGGGHSARRATATDNMKQHFGGYLAWDAKHESRLRRERETMERIYQSYFLLEREALALGD